MIKDRSKSRDKLSTLFLLFLIYQLILHLFFGLKANDPRLIVPSFIAFLHDGVILGAITITGKIVSSFASQKFKNGINQFFNILLLICGFGLAFYPKMLREYLVFPVNLFDSDISSAETLINDYLGLNAVIPSLIALAIGAIGLLSKVKLKNSRTINAIGTVILVLVLGFTVQRPSPQPFVYSIQKEIENFISGKKRVVQSLDRTKKTSSKISGLKMLDYSTKTTSHYNSILLIVLEGVTSNVFENGFLTLKDGFYAQNKNNAVYYKNYYASNLDSYTSLISMLTSIQVPYRAYADATLYDKVNHAPSITEDVQNKGFKTIFVSCYEYQPFVPTRKKWDKIYDRNDLPSIENWLSLGSNKMESATEDKSAISALVENINSNNKSFILHELVYGHSPEWRAITGKTQNIYYNEYLMDLSNQLKKENCLDSTLFVIVSDHGNRAKSSDIENYRIPLLVVGKNSSESTNHELLTNLDLPKIIYHYVFDDDHPKSRNQLFFVGSTEKWVYGKMLKNKNNLFIDDATGIVLHNRGNLNAENVRQEFQDYLDSFNEKYGK